jgi:hypothetical protein
MALNIVSRDKSNADPSLHGSHSQPGHEGLHVYFPLPQSPERTYAGATHHERVFCLLFTNTVDSKINPPDVYLSTPSEHEIEHVLCRQWANKGSAQLKHELETIPSTPGLWKLRQVPCYLTPMCETSSLCCGHGAVLAQPQWWSAYCGHLHCKVTR